MFPPSLPKGARSRKRKRAHASNPQAVRRRSAAEARPRSRFVRRQMSNERPRATLVVDQAIPVIVTDLMAQVTEQCAIWLAHRRAALLACRVAGFLDVQR